MPYRGAQAQSSGLGSVSEDGMQEFLNTLMFYLLSAFIVVLPALLVVQLFKRS